MNRRTFMSSAAALPGSAQIARGGEVPPDRRLHVAACQILTYPEPARSVLVWLNDPDGQRQARDPADWETFRVICGDRYGFDPETDGPITAAQRLGLREGPWDLVWQRFAEAPRRYMNLSELLRRARPQGSGSLFEQRASWPQDNEVEERALREADGNVKLAAVMAKQRVPAGEARRLLAGRTLRKVLEE